MKYSYWDQWMIALQTTDPFSRQRGRLRKKNKVIVRRKKKSKIKCGKGPQREARYPDELVDWLSAVRWTPTRRNKTELFVPAAAENLKSGLCSLVNSLQKKPQPFWNEAKGTWDKVGTLKPLESDEQDPLRFLNMYSQVGLIIAHLNSFERSEAQVMRQTTLRIC
jgi:hypothetical protein